MAVEVGGRGWPERYLIELSGEERVELERRVACYSLPHKVVVRRR